MQGVFYGVGAAVIAVITRSAWKLTKSTLGSKRLSWILFCITAAVNSMDRIGDRMGLHWGGVVALAVRAATDRKVFRRPL